MRILIYGAGVIGAQLAHELARGGGRADGPAAGSADCLPASHGAWACVAPTAGSADPGTAAAAARRRDGPTAGSADDRTRERGKPNKVTVLARGRRKRELEQNGLVIRHHLQRRTTVDRMRVIGRLAPDDVYDLVVVVMQYGQLPEVLPILARNASRRILLVGNNPFPDQAADALRAVDPGKEIAFGFLTSAGRREAGRVISIHGPSQHLTVGFLRGERPAAMRNTIVRATRGTRLRLHAEADMDAWLKIHLAIVLPIAHVCFATGFDLWRASRNQRRLILEAIREGVYALRTAGVQVDAAYDDALRPGARRIPLQALVLLGAKTSLGRLAAADHCRHAPDEVRLLDRAFEHILRQAATPRPAWSELRKQAQLGDRPPAAED